MLKFEQPPEKKKSDEILYGEREDFVREHYPMDKSGHDLEDLLGSGLDGKKVLEKRDGSGDLEAILTYDIDKDNDKVPYLSIGIMLTREESQGEGIMRELIDQAKDVAKKKGREYIVAVADTGKGERFLHNNGFENEIDEANSREHLRFELD
jgi:GNAT superfamily N-acetyltransferase